MCSALCFSLYRSVQICGHRPTHGNSCSRSRLRLLQTATRAMIVIPGGASDADRCAAVYYAAVRDGAAPKYTDAERAAWAPSRGAGPWLVDRLTTGKTWLALEGDELLGFLCAALPEPDSGGGLASTNPNLYCALSDRDAVYLDLFYVVPEQRRGPVAPALYAEFDDWAAERVRTVHASHMLKPFLLRRGWTTVAEKNLQRHGVTLGCWVMKKNR